MIFVGDVAIAQGDQFSFKGFPATLLNKPLCLNLEGAIIQGEQSLRWGVWNGGGWRQSFSHTRCCAAFLANNHILDVGKGIEGTLSALSAVGIIGFGAGANTVDAAASGDLESDGQRYRLVGFGWPVIGCRSAGLARSGVNVLEGRHARRLVAALRARHPQDRLVVVMHWNYEFEPYPQPGHRELAMNVIDLGAHAVIGHHPHIVGPVERYRDRTIAYSLGNWAFSYGRFFNGRLRLPSSSFHQIAIELAEDGDRVHHARFEPPTTVRYLSSEAVGGADFSLRPEFEGFNHQDYIAWFRGNRVKRKGLPVYLDADDSFGNQMRDRWVGFRQGLIDLSAKAGLKPIRRNG